MELRQKDRDFCRLSGNSMMVYKYRWLHNIQEDEKDIPVQDIDYQARRHLHLL